MSSRRIMPIPDSRKPILFWAMLAIVLSGLFPPWLYTFDATGTSDTHGGRSEKSAGYHFILTPPPPEDSRPWFGVKLDMHRLLVEWVCILVVGGTAWGVARLNRAANQKEESVSEL